MVKKISIKTRIAAFFEIFLIMSMIFVMANYNSVNEDGTMIKNKIIIDYEKKEFLLNVLDKFNKIFFSEENLVSAASLDVSDLEKGVYTCPKDKSGRYCQEYTSSSCNDNCQVECLPTPAEQTAFCKPGTCYDSNEGICSTGATRNTCEENNGLWYDEPYGNINICKAGCCVLGENTLFISEQQCQKESLSLGIQKLFKPDVKTELACLALSQTQVMGACVIEREFDNTCKFVSKTNCEVNIRGKFHEGYLCSNPELNTICEKQKSISCIEGKHEVYWKDSCGNIENIYESNKIRSWNDGLVLQKNESCSLSSSSNPFANQESCGNCNYYSASICGGKTLTEKLSEKNAEVVCRDLRCKDESGKIRKNGESWCAYQGSIGLDSGVNKERSTNPVGSRSFKKTCYEGEIITDPCADYDNEICTQSSIKNSKGEEFTNAACRTNRGYECYQYNQEGRREQCTQNTDCFIKEINIDKGFKFDICAPKYTPGFDLSDRGGGAAGICSIANQKCQVVYVKKISGWDCVSNCDCAKTQKFAEQMNDLCISLGDCGTKANYLGDVSINHEVYKSSKKKNLGKKIGGEYGGLSNNYINKISIYANEKTLRNNFIEAPNLDEFYGQLGVPGSIGLPLDMPVDKTSEVMSQINTITGVSGLAVTSALFSIGYFGGGAIGSMGSISSTIGLGKLIAPNLAAFSGALTGAAIGFAVVSMLIQFTGVGAGLPPGLIYALTGAGAAAGAVIGISMMAAGNTALGTSAAAGSAGAFGAGATAWAAAATVAWVLIIVIIIAVAVFAIIGIGDIKKEFYTFQCMPWEAPSGGDKCSECGKDGYICSKYACNSLGQNCEFINEGSQNPECIQVAKDDVSAPVIKINETFILEGYTFDLEDNGVIIKTNSEEGCIPESYMTLPLGLNIDEAARCTISNDMEEIEIEGQYLSSGLYKRFHPVFLDVPLLSSFGLANFNPDSKAELSYYIKCEDKNGNENINSYAINFCIMPSKDITPPLIIEKEPKYNAVKKDSNFVNVSIFTNEPSECRWSLEDKNYENMENDFLCANEFIQKELFGWRCIYQLPLETDEKTYYIRCLDQPWLGIENYSERNPNRESFNWTIRKVSEPLKIDYISVDNKTFEFNVTPSSLTIEVETSGGLNGEAKCGYVWGNKTIEFFQTWSRKHKQVSPAYFSGNYELKIKCEDLIGNVAESVARFEIKLDNEPPKVTRVYSNNKNIYVVTDEKSNCFYTQTDYPNCYFDINHANKTSQNMNFLHSISIDYGKTYNIKCVDEYGHYPGECSVVVRGVEA